MLNRMKIGAKLTGGFMVVALVAVAIGITTFICQRSLANSTAEIYEKATIPEGQLIGMTESMQGLRVASRDAILDSDKQKCAVNVNSLKDALTRQAEEFQKTIALAVTRKDFETFQQQLREYENNLDRVIALTLGGKEKEAAQMIRESSYMKSAADVQDSFDRLRDDKLSFSEQKMQESSALASKASKIMIASTALGLA
jgi:methyl-accepting chemotaxis protein